MSDGRVGIPQGILTPGDQPGTQLRTQFLSAYAISVFTPEGALERERLIRLFDSATRPSDQEAKYEIERFAPDIAVFQRGLRADGDFRERHRLDRGGRRTGAAGGCFLSNQGLTLRKVSPGLHS